MRPFFVCLVCAVAAACDSDLSWSVEDKLCTIEGACLEGYVCSSEHKCIPIQVATARKPDAGVAKPQVVIARKPGATLVEADAGIKSSPEPAAHGGEPRDASGPVLEVEAAVPAHASDEAGMPATQQPPAMPSSQPERTTVADSGAPAEQPDTGVVQPIAGVGGQGAATPPTAMPSGGMTAPPQVPSVDASMPGCGAGTTLCGSACIDLQHEPQHCGACDRQCSAPEHGEAACDDGRCAVRCDESFTRCGNACVRLDGDRSNCGECGRACSGAQGAVSMCESGQCRKQCRSGLQMCGDQCVDLQRDTANCNACGASCPSSKSGTATCEAAVCKLRCAKGQVACQGSCVASWDRCSSSVGLTTPVGPVCLLGGKVCADHCVSPSDDTEHCGECNHACKNKETCTNGRCTSNRR